MAVPGTTILQRDAAPPRTLPTDTGVWFVVGKAQSGPTNEPTPIRSLSAYEHVFGQRTGAEVLYDSLDAYFRYGGRLAYVVNVAEGEGGADSDYAEALASIDRELGPGQVSAPGVTSAAVHAALLAHAADANRVALIDLEDTADEAEVAADLAALRNNEHAHLGAAFVPWAIIPGIAAGTTRTVPYSAIQAALIARNDAINGPHVPAAGERGEAPILGLTQDYKAEQREAIHLAGGNVVRSRAGGFRTYGYQTLADREAKPLHWQLSQVRVDMAIAARAEEVAERFMFALIDGRGVTLSQFGSELASMLQDFWLRGALYGETPDEAYRVDVGEAVNPPEALARGEIRAVLSVRRSPYAEAIVIEIVKNAITEAV